MEGILHPYDFISTVGPILLQLQVVNRHSPRLASMEFPTFTHVQAKAGFS